MPKHKYAEIPIGHAIEHVANEDDFWSDYQPFYPFVEWSNVKAVARRYLTPKQYIAFVVRGERGAKHEDLGIFLGTSRQAAVCNLKLGIKKLKKIFKKYLQNRVNMRGGFSEHIKREKRIKRNSILENNKKIISYAKCAFCKEKIRREGIIRNGKIYHNECFKKAGFALEEDILIKKIYLGTNG